MTLLPALLLRSLIPVGFMPMFGPGLSVSLMLCPAYAPVPTPLGDVAGHAADEATANQSMDMSTGMDMSMDMPMGPSEGPPPQPTHGGMPGTDYQQHSLCPYAKSATLAGSLASLRLPVAQQSSTTLALPAPQIAFFLIVPRAQSARAPPLLS